jgi:predicted MFS family arabinose efflux permease
MGGVLIGGRVADRIGPKFTTGISLAGLCIGLLLLQLALDSRRFIEVVLGLISAVAQLFFPAQQASLAHDFPNRRGTALAWNNSALFLGISLGSLMGGEAIVTWNFGTNLVMAACIAVVGCVVSLMVVPGAQLQRRAVPSATACELSARR